MHNVKSEEDEKSVFEKLNIALSEKLKDPLITGTHEYTVDIDNLRILVSLDHSTGMIKLVKVVGIK